MKIILASSSPRRKELLTQIGFVYDSMSSDKEEIIAEGEPKDAAVRLASGKAEEIYGRIIREGVKDDVLIIGADTIVVHEGKILGKPKDKADGENMLRALSGKEHHVWTGVKMIYLCRGVRVERMFAEETKVVMYSISEEEIQEYLATNEPYDKAGAYAIQGMGARFIKKIEGDYNNVVGLPAGRIYQEIPDMKGEAERKKAQMPEASGEETEKKEAVAENAAEIRGEETKAEENKTEGRGQKETDAWPQVGAGEDEAGSAEDAMPDIPWYDKAVFYHIYPLGLCGCAHENTGVQESHFGKLNAWALHAKKIGCNAIYIGPLFESVGHGYETTDYKLVDRRLGTNEDFQRFVALCHKNGIKVVVDGVFNHTGREFFAFKDIKQNRENSKYKNWYCNVNFGGNNEYNDGFSYENWGGYNLLAKLNVWNPEVKNYLFDVVRFWVNEFDIDGIRLDAADVLDMGFMSELRGITRELKKDFWLMGEVIHGDYGRWANSDRLNSVTNYELHKGLYSGHNDHNYFEIAHTINRLNNLAQGIKLYTFVDNHDVARIHSKLTNKEHMYDVTMLLYTVPGIPSIYYGSEFAVDGDKQKGSDWNLRPDLKLEDYSDTYEKDELVKLIMKLGQLKKTYRELTEGAYEQMVLTNRQFAFARKLNGRAVITALNNDDNGAAVNVRIHGADAKLLAGKCDGFEYNGENLSIKLPANRGCIFYVS